MFAYATRTPPPEKPIEQQIADLIEEGAAVATALFAAHRIRAQGLEPDPPAWVIRLQVESIHDELDLLLSELDRRRI